MAQSFLLIQVYMYRMGLGLFTEVSCLGEYEQSYLLEDVDWVVAGPVEF